MTWVFLNLAPAPGFFSLQLPHHLLPFSFLAYWLQSILLVGIALIPDIFVKWWRQIVSPYDWQILRVPSMSLPLFLTHVARKDIILIRSIQSKSISIRTLPLSPSLTRLDWIPLRASMRFMVKMRRSLRSLAKVTPFWPCSEYRDVVVSCSSQPS